MMGFCFTSSQKSTNYFCWKLSSQLISPVGRRRAAAAASFQSRCRDWIRGGWMSLTESEEMKKNHSTYFAQRKHKWLPAVFPCSTFNNLLISQKTADVILTSTARTARLRGVRASSLATRWHWCCCFVFFYHVVQILNDDFRQWHS